MIEFVKDLIGLFFKISGLSWLIREKIIRNKVTIINYHDPKFSTFEKHLEYLVSNYRLIRLSTLSNALQESDFLNIPPKSLIITFDDGRKGNYALLELFKKNKVFPAIFLCSSVINSKRHYWWLYEKNISNDTINQLKTKENNERLCIMEKYGFRQTDEQEIRQALNLYEIMIMKDYVEFGSHSCFHPILPTCQEKECKSEIMDSKREIEKLIGAKCISFAYPNGLYSEREIEIVRKAGYQCARTIDIGWNDITSDPYKLKCIGVADNSSINWLIAQLTGIPGYVKSVIYNIKGF